ncbi:hypothetical protein Ancab_001312 [Ancistrocladus abbreviatus]
MSFKGKEVAGKASSGKRKRNDDDKTGGGGRNRSVLQFFDDVAAEFDADEDSGDDSDFLNDLFNDCEAEIKEKNQPGKSHELPFMPKEEELSGDELERVLEERYRSGSGYVTYAEDAFETKRSAEGNFIPSSLLDPPIWKVKCKVGRERQTVFSLMQKYMDLKLLGTKLQMVSAFAVEHIKGFVFVEATKQSDVSEACRQLPDVYYSLVTQVPKGEVSHLLAVRRKHNEVTAGMWARVKNGNYKGDLAQVVAVNDLRKKATVKLIPRIDIEAMAQKFGGGASAKKASVQGVGASAKKAAVPVQRLIRPSDLEEFRPLIQYKRDRDTGKHFEVLDGLMLKDGYLYKKVSIDSLSFWDVNPSEEELHKFTLSNNDESNNTEWLSQLYGEEKKRQKLKTDKGGAKGEASSGSSTEDSLEVHDLVVFGKKEFGMVVGLEKDDTYKILKEGSEGPTVVSLGRKDLKIVRLEKKVTALDHRMKTISINDTLRILDGAAKGKQGIVKQIYRGIIFLYDENQLDDDAYFCARSQLSEKVKRCDDSSQGKDGEAGPSAFGDFSSSPKSPLSPDKPWQTKENSRDFSHKDKEGMFSVGQTLRIRIGPLKGYLCRVLAVRYSDVTVKLASQQRVLTVKSEHLSEVRAKSFGASVSDDPGSSSAKPFDLLGTEGCSNDWIQGACGAGDTDGWTGGGLSSERSSWPAFASSGSSLQWGSNSANSSGAAGNDSGKAAEDAVWQTKVSTDQNSVWGKAVEEKAVAKSEQSGGWGKTEGGWGNSSEGDASGSGQNTALSGGDNSGSWKDRGSSWGPGKLKVGGPADPSNEPGASWDINQDNGETPGDSWGKGKKVTGNEASNWGNEATETGQWGSMNKGQDINIVGSWDNKGSGSKDKYGSGSSAWGQQKTLETGKAVDEGWGKLKEVQDKGTRKPVETSWGSAVDNLGNKNDSSGSQEWKNATAPKCQSGGWSDCGGAWGQAQEKSAVSGWGKGSSAEDNQSGRWGNSNSSEAASGWQKSGDSISWEKSKNFDNGEGFNGGRGSGGRRGRGGRAGRDQSNRGRGGFGRGNFSSWNKEGQDGSYGENSFGGNGDRGGLWGKESKGWSTDGGVRDSMNQSKLAVDNVQSWNKGWGAGRESGGTDQLAGVRASTKSAAWNSGTTNCEGSSGTAGWNSGSSASGGWGAQKSWGKGENVNNDNSCWGKAMKSADKDMAMPVNDAWAKVGDFADKGTGDQPEDSWGKAAQKWGNKTGSSGSKEWNSSTAASERQFGSLGEAGGNSAELQGNISSSWNKGSNSGWKKGGNSSQVQTDSWSKPNAFSGDDVSWNKSSGNDGWNQSENAENDQGFNGGRGSRGRRGRGSYRGGREQFGRGRGRSFGRGECLSSNNDSGSCGNLYGGSSGQSSGWGKDKGGGFGGGGWSKSSTGNGEQSNGWGKNKAWDNDRMGEDQGWKRQRTSADGNESSEKKGWGALPSHENGASGVHGSESDKWNAEGPSNERGSGTGGWNSESSRGWGHQICKDNAEGVADKNSTWGKVPESQEKGNGSDVNDSWTKGKGVHDKGTSCAEDSWGKAAQWGNKSSSSGSKEWKTSATAAESSQIGGLGEGVLKWGQPQEENAAGGWSQGKTGDGESAGGWKKGSDSSHGQTESWSKPSWSKSAGSDTWGRSKNGESGSGWKKGGESSHGQTESWSKPSWSKSAGNEAWGQSRNSENDRGFEGDRGFGGRRGRGGFHGGRDGRGRGGRSFGRGQFSSWGKESQDGSSWRNSADNNEGSGWGKEKNWSDGGKSGNSFGGNSDQGVGKSKGWSTGGGSWGNSSAGNNDRKGERDNVAVSFGASNDQGGDGMSKRWNGSDRREWANSSGVNNDQEGGGGNDSGWNKEEVSSAKSSVGGGWGQGKGNGWGK